MNNSENNRLTPNLSKWGALAFSIGTALGWGSMVVTGSSYLAQSGIAGSIIGMLLGTAVMLIVARNYSYMMQIYPDAGGAYTYSREVFGHDYGFLTGWFLSLTYLSVLWANETSVPLFVRYFAGPVLQFGKLYTLFGYDIYAGEIIVTLAVVLLTALLCIRSRAVTAHAMTALAAVFAAGIAAVFIFAFVGRASGDPAFSWSPAYVPDAPAISQIIRIAVISPWAFIGFESISHRAEEFSFERTRIFRILVAAVIITAALYIMLLILSVTAYPERYASWLEYIRDRGNLEGLEALPAFYAADYYMGSAGVGIMMLSLFALVITSLIGNTTAAARLFCALGREGLLPKRFSEINKHGTTGNAIKLIAAVSCLIPFVGRTSIGWIVDVTTICAILIYGLVSAAAFKRAGERNDRTERITGLAGIIIMTAYGLYTLIPNLITEGSIERETYFLFIIWALLGFIIFRAVLSRDKDKKYGHSIVVWVVMLSLVLFITLVWMRQSMIASNKEMLANVDAYYEQMADEDRAADEAYIQQQVHDMEADDNRTILVSLLLLTFATVIMLSNNAFMNRRAKESDVIANVDPMTGVKSKHAYLSKCREIDREITDGSMGDFSVVVCDVNGLKYINDNLGHKAGDEYICAASKLICEIFQHSPVYRIGGDEFVLILTGRDNEIRKELLGMLHRQSVENISSDRVVVSGGLSEFDPYKDRDFHSVFERADGFMYEEKQLLKGLGSVSRETTPEDLKETEAVPETSFRKTILIADDEEINLMILGNILKDDYELLFAENGRQALELLDSHGADISLLLLDLIMPEADGMEVLRKVRLDPKYNNLPVIVITSNQDSEVECLKKGASDFISKPYPKPEVIKVRISKCLDLAEMTDAITSTERDHLTGLYNTDYFMWYVNMYDHHYPDADMDAVVFDITRFHVVNALYGKAYADDVLGRLGRTLRAAARETGGFACRKEADIFLLYCHHQEDHKELYEKVSAGLSKEEKTSGRVRLRMGVYADADKSFDIERRFDRAKMAANDERSRQLGNIGMYEDGMYEESLRRESLLDDFNASLEDGRFRLYLQPKYDIRPDVPVLSGAEALVRWEHHKFGLVAPADFIPMLEESGQILDLDSYIWNETAAAVRRWKDSYGFDLPVSVNVSRADMLSPRLKSIFREILDRYSLTTDDIVLEITESAYTGDSSHVISVARELRGEELGFRIEMDDFGSGYSSLGTLSQLPVDALKLDMSFVRSSFGASKGLNIIKLIIGISDEMGVDVIAEGVETREQMTVLKELGCEYAQGFYFSKPVPDSEFEEKLVKPLK